ncbi:hypothetical protein, partial [Nitrospira lenta]|uniref:hypothetical protein n=1 Tax=Nitrospira lenta TaxID=1436998 RepID=UPI001C64CDD5
GTITSSPKTQQAKQQQLTASPSDYCRPHILLAHNPRSALPSVQTEWLLPPNLLNNSLPTSIY